MTAPLFSYYRYQISMPLEMIVSSVIIECIVQPEEWHLGRMIVVFNLTVFSLMCLKV